jgi:hypothetical protein
MNPQNKRKRLVCRKPTSIHDVPLHSVIAAYAVLRVQLGLIGPHMTWVCRLKKTNPSALFKQSEYKPNIKHNTLNYTVWTPNSRKAEKQQEVTNDIGEIK